MRIRSVRINNYAKIEDCRFDISGPSTLSFTGQEDWDGILVVLWKMVFRRKLDRFQFDDMFKPLSLEIAFQISFDRDANRTQIGVDQRVVDHMVRDMLYIKLEQAGPGEYVRLYVHDGKEEGVDWVRPDEDVFISTLKELCAVDEKAGVRDFLHEAGSPVINTSLEPVQKRAVS